jgi:aspartyl/asparaginyl beta-hydroxylase
MKKLWSKLCDVDTRPLVEAVGDPLRWSDGGNGIWRLFDVPRYLAEPILERVFSCFDERVRAIDVMVNKVEPGFSHAMHVDRQIDPYWVTRVHVPIVTNPQCWHRWESDMVKVHFPVGSAYSFDTESRHDFANEGPTPRIHLLFDVHRII